VDFYLRERRGHGACGGRRRIALGKGAHSWVGITDDAPRNLQLGASSFSTLSGRDQFLDFVCGIVHCVYSVLGYAEMASEITLYSNPLAPEYIVLTYRPAKEGYLILRREGFDRVTEFFDEIAEEEVGHEQTLLWRGDGLRNGDLLAARYRQGWEVITQEWPNLQVDSKDTGNTVHAD